MKLRKKGGHIYFQPYEILFTVIETGGSLHQNYDATAGEYIADRTLTPLVLRPMLSLSNSQDGSNDGDHSLDLLNVVWTVTALKNGHAPVSGTDYVVAADTHELRVMFNLDPGTSGSIACSAEYYDQRRGDVIKLYWSGQLGCTTTADWRVMLQTDWPMRTNLFPWKDRGIFTIPVQLTNGDSELPDAKCVYRWQIFESNAWRNIDRQRDFWCRGGENTKAISIEQKYTQKLLLRCMAWPADQPSELQFAAFLVRRYYGAYDDDVEIVEGKYIFPATARTVAEVWVEKRKGGRIASPEQFFDIELLYSRGDGHWWHVSHGTRGEVPRSMFPVDSSMQHLWAEATREITAELPLAVDGAVLTLDGAVAMAHHPIIERDYDED